MARCDACGKDVALPFTCKQCGGRFCSEHRLPENHSCRAAGAVKRSRTVEESAAREDTTVTPAVRFNFDQQPGRKKRRLPLPRLWSLTIAVLIVAAFVGQLIAEGLVGRNYYIPGDYGTFLYYLTPSGATALTRPWTLLTSMFMHGGFLHMLVNLIVLLSFGPALELRIGKKRFLYVYLGSGILAAAAQLLVIPPETVVLGASGAILGVMGALTMLAPRTPVLLFFIIPMPLWMATAGFGIISALFAITGYGGSVAHLAHLTGIVVGVAYGYKLRREERRRMMRMVKFFSPWFNF